MKKTEHLNLNQWDPTDRILRTDFNADNAAIDAALGALTAAPGKLGRMEVIDIRKSDGTTCGSGFSSSRMAPEIDWSEWEYICILGRYPNAAMDASDLSAVIMLNRKASYHWFKSIAMPGFLVVLLPQHNPDANVAGFLLNDRFAPFSLNFTYRDFSGITINQQSGSFTFPDIVYLGGK